MLTERSHRGQKGKENEEAQEDEDAEDVGDGVRVFLYTSHRWGLEEWDYRSPSSPGIGGSETAQVEVTWRLARRGHDVVSYAPIPDGCKTDWRKTGWYHSRYAEPTLDGLWILSRCPEVMDKFGPRRKEQPRWLVCQDTHYDGFKDRGMNKERASKLDVVFALCPQHVDYLKRRYSYLADKVVLSGNGIKSGEIHDLLSTRQPERNPHRLIWTSSPDRGLATMLRIFKRAREFVPTLELHCFYGWDNIEKFDDSDGGFWAKARAECESLLDQPGVTWHGRVGQSQLYLEYLKSSLWAYPTAFSETSCISAMEAQALGCIPISVPFWGIAHNVLAGTLIEGFAATDPLTRARYVGEIVRYATDEKLQATVRTQMTAAALERFDWEHVVDQYEGLLNA